MRLLQLQDDDEFRLVEFGGDNVPPYAILSHTWGADSDEVSFEDILARRYKRKAGYKKLSFCAKQAAKDGLQYSWVDTCCINKSSSAELSEAINSMYMWYRQADICYAYLSDVDDRDQFCDSRWFKRGWTLQELLAPADVLFFDASWVEIGFKTSLTSVIEQRTGISEVALRDGSSFGSYSIAEKMSWAAGRRTTRIEDEAYCLIGIFNINMPLLYGEGRKAFFRLQEELLKRSDDASIFAYIAFEPTSSEPTTLRLIHEDGNIRVSEHIEKDGHGQFHLDEEPKNGAIGLFSSSPSCFRDSAKFIPHRIPLTEYYGTPVERSALTFKLSGHLVEFQVPVWRVPIFELQNEPDFNLFSEILIQNGLLLNSASIQKARKCIWAADHNTWIVAFLDCRRRNGGAVGIVLRESSKQGVYFRQHFPSVIESKFPSMICNDGNLKVETIYVEADSLRMTQTGTPDPSLLKPLQLNDRREDVAFRETNLKDVGYQEGQATVDEIRAIKFYHNNDLDFPLIAFFAERRDQMVPRPIRSIDAQGLTCRFYPNPGIRYHYEIKKDTEVACELIPIDRGATMSMSLNANYYLLLRTQMQWKRYDSALHIENLKKKCLITVSMVPATEMNQERIRKTDLLLAGNVIRNLTI